jgi:hypothetical protein
LRERWDPALAGGATSGEFNFCSILQSEFNSDRSQSGHSNKEKYFQPVSIHIHGAHSREIFPSCPTFAELSAWRLHFNGYCLSSGREK